MSSTGKTLTDKVLQFLYDREVPSSSSVLVALSGGPDSTALLYALYLISEKYPLTLSAAYVNHGLRDPSELKKDDDFVRQLTAKMGVQLYEKHVEQGLILNLAAKESRSTEEVARAIRYDFFDTVMKENHHQFLLVGHNWDDQMETMVIRMFQGSGFQGLKGIPHCNGYVLRPLIHCSRMEILDFLNEVQSDYRIDPTNQENDYQRNRVRNQLIPLLQEIFPGISKSLRKQESRFTAMDSIINREAESVPVRKISSGVSVPLDRFNHLNDFVRLRLLFRMFDTVYRGNNRDFRVPSVFFNPLVGSTVADNRILASSYGVSIRTDACSLIVENAAGKESGFFAIIGDKDLSVAGFRIKIKEEGKQPLNISSDSPLVFRSPLPGDVLITDTGKISINEQMRKGNSFAILEDSLGILAFWGEIYGGKNFYRKKLNKTESNFNILYLEIKKEETE